MKVKFFKSLSVLLSLVLFVSVISIPSFNVKAEGPVESFVERCYQVVLGRGSDAGGKNYWVDRLTKDDAKDGRATGGFVAYSFLVSPEFLNKQCSNEQFVESLYTMFMNRGSDADGLAYWSGRLERREVDRLGVIAGFINSEEFYKICDNAGITAGSFPIDNPTQEQVAQMNQVNLFVDRMYEKCMGRRGDYGGQYYWLSKLLSKEITGVECAKFFVSSPEFADKNLTDEGYVEVLYRVFMGREYDDAGKTYWLLRLKYGMTRDEVFEGFAMSPEFGRICESYGIARGTYKATDKGTYEINRPNYKVGDILLYGKYEQDNNTSNGKENIEWQVLSVEEDRILVISKYVLDCKQYNKANGDITWEKCSLRQWLQNVFYNTAFSRDEKKWIPSVNVENKDNPLYGTKAGKDTTDKIFCLSLDEAEKYFGEFQAYYKKDMIGYKQNLMGVPTEYALSKGIGYMDITEDKYYSPYWWNPDTYEWDLAFKDIYTTDVIGKRTVCWFLRTPGQDNSYTCSVRYCGRVGAGYDLDVDYEEGIRPAMYIMY
ncbi:MAG: DUF4214 domain-containing protein [Lachnospiraceae bacterium]|nr:DUF4214 domain-containing protein [Lachnospiraceae bacterium]